MKQYLEIGKVNNTHALKGEVKLELWCDGVDFLKALKHIYTDARGEKALTLLSARPQKQHAILKFAEITTVEEAEKLKGRVLYCNRSEAPLEEDAYFLTDLIGCYVVDADTEEEYGRITDVMNYGSCDIYDVEQGGKHILVPATPDIIVEINTEYEVVRIRPMKGLFDED